MARDGIGCNGIQGEDRMGQDTGSYRSYKLEVTVSFPLSDGRVLGRPSVTVALSPHFSMMVGTMGNELPLFPEVDSRIPSISRHHDAGSLLR